LVVYCKDSNKSTDLSQFRGEVGKKTLQVVAELAVMWGMTFMGRLLALAGERRLSQRELARRAGIDPSRVTEWKKREDGDGGGKGPSVEDAVALARALGTTVAYLVGEAAEPDAGAGGLAEDDEQAILTSYRAYKRLGLIDGDRAIVALNVAMHEAAHAIVAASPAAARGEAPPAIDPTYKYPAIPADPTPGVTDRLAEQAERQASRTGGAARHGKRRG
jgi:transcriptional regulator with XRE-family HTH domain